MHIQIEHAKTLLISESTPSKTKLIKSYLLNLLPNFQADTENDLCIIQSMELKQMQYFVRALDNKGLRVGRLSFSATQLPLGDYEGASHNLHAF